MPKTDILVLGATGYTGGLIVRYLANHPERASFSLALGARSSTKLAKLVKDNALTDVKLLEVDVVDEPRVRDVLKDFHVVIAAVGPYCQLGKTVVQVCAEFGVHYVDISGEAEFMLWCIDNYDYQASKSHSIIINAAGFNSIPSDISAYIANQSLKKAAGPHASCGDSVSAVEFNMSGGISGGTLQTSIQGISGKTAHMRKGLEDEYAFTPGERKINAGTKLIHNLPHTNVVGSLSPLSIGNEQVVRRTWGLNRLHALTTNAVDDHLSAYGSDFRYREFLLRRSWWHSVSTNAFWVAAFVALLVPPVRALAIWWYPKPGEGPSDSALQEGWFRITNITSSPRTTPSAAAEDADIVVKTTIQGCGEPAYLLTSIMVSEIALLLTPRHSHSLTNLGRQGGVLTSMSALGQPLIDRLAASGNFNFNSEVLQSKQN